MGGIHDLPPGHLYWDTDAMDVGVSTEPSPVDPQARAVERRRTPMDRLIRRKDQQPAAQPPAPE